MDSPDGAGPAAPRAFTLTRDDLIEAHRAVMRHQYRRWGAWLRTLVFVAAAFAGVVAAGGDIAGALATGGGMLILFPIFVYAFGLPWHVRRLMRHDRRFGEVWRFAITPDAIQVWTANGDMRHLWAAVTSRIDTSNLMLLMTGASFIPVPLRALGPGDRDLILRHLEDAGA